MIMRDYDVHQAQQSGELPGGGLLARFWRNLARQLAVLPSGAQRLR